MPGSRLCVVITVLWVSPAWANLAASRPVPAVASSLESPGTALAVTAEALSITCEEVRREPACTFTAVYTVENPTDTQQSALAAFAGVRAEAVRVTRDGVAIDRPLTDEERERLSLGRTLARQEVVERRGVEMTLEPGASTRLSVTGRLNPGRYFVASYTESPVTTRHPLLGSEVPRSDTFHLDYLVSPLRTWAKQPMVQVTLSLPSAWVTRVHVLSVGGAREVEPALTAKAGVTVRDFTLDGARDEELKVAFELPPRRFFNGGVLLGVGGVFDSGARLRLRAGYQVAAPHWWLYSLVGETDARSEVLVVPSIEVATPSLLVVIPSAALGLGVPVRLAPDVRAGLRVQGSLHWPYVGVALALDLFPGAAANVAQFSLLASVGL
ncbi:MAG: hypothetical protein AB1938_01745 [Myxococcota bacterium]